MTLRARLALASVSGAIAAAGFPEPGWWPLVFVAWAPLVRAVSGASARGAAACGALAGLVFHALLLRWLAALTVPGWLVLAAYLSIYTAAFAAATAVLVRRPRWWTAAAIAATWAALEWARGWLFTGFSWGGLGYAMAPCPAMVQLAAIGGVSLVSFCAVAVSAILADAWPAARARRWRKALPPIAAAVAVPFAMAGYGALAIGEVGGARLRVAVVQGDIDARDKWTDDGAFVAMSRYTRLSERAAGEHAAVIVWPETALPVPLEAEPGRAVRTRGIRRAVDRLGAALLVGVPEPVPGEHGRYWNAARLFDGGAEQTPYRKRRLVPFGEYTPMPSVFSWVPKMVSGPDFVHGGGGPPFAVGGARLGVLICFEDVFADEAVARAQVSDAFAVITNDAWFGPVGIAQHRDITALRAVETRRSIARAANTGVSELIDPYGRSLARAAPGQSYAVADVPLTDELTWFARAPDGFALLALTGALLALAAAWIRGRSAEQVGDADRLL